MRGRNNCASRVTLPKAAFRLSQVSPPVFDSVQPDHKRRVADLRYSYRSACVGAIRAALRAGTYTASIVTTTIDGTTTT